MMRLSRVALVASLVLVAQMALADVYEFQPTPADLYDLQLRKAYRWGIQPNIPEDEVVTEASLFFNNIRDWTTESNDLYVTLLDSAPVGVTVLSDYYGGGNYFSSWGPLLVHYHNIPAYPQDLTYDFTEGQVDTLSEYIEDNNFGLGFDPDCNFYNCGIKLTLQTVPKPNGPGVIPEPFVGSIVLGGIGMILARRKRR